MYMLFLVIVHHVQILQESFKAVGTNSNGQMWQEIKESDDREKNYSCTAGQVLLCWFHFPNVILKRDYGLALCNLH